jgi:predicted nucleotidyltransferase
MLEKLFTSKTRVKLLNLFLLNPETELYVREIARKTGENTNAIRRELQNLEDIGLLLSEKKGNLKYYSVNKIMPIYLELTNIILKTGGVGRTLSENLTMLGNIETAFIYGSFASGSAGAKSDIDLFIIGQVHEDELIRSIEKLEKELFREINYVLFSPAEFSQRIRNHDPFIKNVLNEKRVMLIGDLNEH